MACKGILGWWLSLCGIGLGSGAALAAPADLDPSFDGDGIVVDAMSGNGAVAHDVAVDGSGRIVVAGIDEEGSVIFGNFGVLRLTADGTPDATFAGDGRASFTFGAGTQDEAYGLALQADGKLVLGGLSFAAGPAGNDFAAMRANADGTLDAGFGVGGMVKSNLANTDLGLSMALAPDGGVLLGGYVDIGGQLDAAAFRLTPGGQPDAGFGVNGLALGAADTNSAFAVAVQGDGKALLGGGLDDAGGSGADNAGSGVGMVLRLNADGTLDAGFAGDGRAELPAFARIEGFALQPDGRVIAVGTALGNALGVARLNADGTPDAGFGSGGVATVAPGSLGAAVVWAYDAAVQADGKIVVAGEAAIGGQSVMIALRFTAGGQPDAGFGTGGARVLSGLGLGEANAVTIQPDGRIVLAGATQDTAQADPQFAVVRLLGGDGGGTLPTLAVGDASLVEGDAGNTLMAFTITVSPPSGGGVAVNAATDLGTATPSVDYVPTSANVTFAQGATTATFQVPVIGDVADEPNETFLVQLSGAIGATVGDGTATGTIVDDDEGVAPPAPAQPVPGPGLFALMLLAALLLAIAARRRIA